MRMLTAWALLVGCTTAPPAPVPPAADPEATAVRALTAPPRERVMVDEALPARFDAPWPASPTDRSDVWAREDAIHRLCLGETSAESRLQASVSAAVQQGAPIADVARGWSDTVRWCSDPRFCDDVLTRIDAAPSTAHARVLWAMAARCGGRLPPEQLVHEGVPDEAVFAWTDSYVPDVPDSVYAHLLVVVRRNLKTASEQELRSAAWKLGEAQDPALKARIAELRREVPAGVGSSLEPRAPLGTPQLMTPFEQAAGQDLSADWLRAHPEHRAEALGRLEACARSDVYGERLSCTRTLAELDWSRARAAWAEREPVEAWEMDLATALKRFESPEDLVAHLRSLGFSPRPDREGRPFETPPTTALDVLQAWGRVHAFDVETDMFPNQHDSLLRDLSALGEPVLKPVRYDETAPSPDTMEGPYLLHAWTEGKRLSVGAENLGDWYDLEAVGELFSGVVAQQGVDLDLALAYTGDQTAIVFVGPEAAVAAVIDQRLVLTEQGAEAMRRGKAAEERVLRGMGE